VRPAAPVASRGVAAGTPVVPATPSLKGVCVRHEVEKAGTRVARRAAPAPEIFVPILHHFGGPCVRARALCFGVSRLGQGLCAPGFRRGLPLSVLPSLEGFGARVKRRLQEEV